VFLGFLLFVSVMGWFTALASVALSPKARRPGAWPVITFPIFSLVLSAAVLFTLAFPTHRWKPIPHGANCPHLRLSQAAVFFFVTFCA
jgi:hypothetical protein